MNGFKRNDYEDLNITFKHLASTKNATYNNGIFKKGNTSVKVQLLKDSSKKTNFNKNTNTLYVNKKDTSRYQMFSDVIKSVFK